MTKATSQVIDHPCRGSSAVPEQPAQLPAPPDPVPSCQAAKPPSAEDQARAEELAEYRRRVPPISFREVDPERPTVRTIEVEYAGDRAAGDNALMFALGTRETKFMEGLLLQLGGIGMQGPAGGTGAVDFLVAATKGIEPRDQVEGMLAAQMAVVHLATMHSASLLMRAQTIPEREARERTFNRCARTFVAQTEALKRYRANGEQKVTVQHVNVSDGGQAVVGTVVHGGSGSGREEK